MDLTLFDFMKRVGIIYEEKDGWWKFNNSASSMLSVDQQHIISFVNDKVFAYDNSVVHCEHLVRKDDKSASCENASSISTEINGVVNESNNGGNTLVPVVSSTNEAISSSQPPIHSVSMDLDEQEIIRNEPISSESSDYQPSPPGERYNTSDEYSSTVSQSGNQADSILDFPSISGSEDISNRTPKKLFSTDIKPHEYISGKCSLEEKRDWVTANLEKFPLNVPISESSEISNNPEFVLSIVIKNPTTPVTACVNYLYTVKQKNLLGEYKECFYAQSFHILKHCKEYLPRVYRSKRDMFNSLYVYSAVTKNWTSLADILII